MTRRGPDRNACRKGGLQAGFINLNSLRADIDQIRQFLTDNPSYDLLGIAETWLDSAVSDDVIRIPVYKVIRQDRNVNDGGVALFVSEHLRCEVLATSGTERKGKPKLSEFVFCSINDCQESSCSWSSSFWTAKDRLLQKLESC